MDSDPCVTSPESRYRGAENQLYRVEIHKSGPALNGRTDENGNPTENAENAATFKWSRENGSVIFPIRKIEGEVIALEHLGRDSRFGLHPNDWVEVVDDDYILRDRAEVEDLLQIMRVDYENGTVTLKSVPWLGAAKPEKHPILRRWDHQAGDQKSGGLRLSKGAALVVEGRDEADSTWLTLEDGVQIQFQPLLAKGPNIYRAGDYWLVPARVATGDVEWPKGPKENDDRDLIPIPLWPHGIIHYYAPLAIIKFDPSGQIEATSTISLRRKLKPLWE